MPKGPEGQKRPADVIGNAIKVAKIATGEEQEDLGADDGKLTRRRSRWGSVAGRYAPQNSPKRGAITVENHT